MSKNTQPIEKQFCDPTGIVEVHHTFFTIQGEGPFTGERAVFIRLAGCNLQCPGCDTEYTSQRTRMTPAEVVAKIQNDHPELPTGGLVVISGGEPFRQNTGEMCYALRQAGYEVQIESNGVRAPDELTIELVQRNEVTLVISPKTKAIAKINGEIAHAFKYVLSADNIDPDDGLPIQALEHRAVPRVARPPEGFGGIVYINPYDEKDEALNARHLAAAVQSCMQHGYRLGVQLHKLIDVE